MKEQDDGVARPWRHVPDDDLLTVRGGQRLLLGAGQARSGWRRAGCRRNREYKRALLEKQHGGAAQISDHGGKRDPFQNGHVEGRSITSL
jgi:hypothetical protein